MKHSREYLHKHTKFCRYIPVIIKGIFVIKDVLQHKNTSHDTCTKTIYTNFIFYSGTILGK